MSTDAHDLGAIARNRRNVLRLSQRAVAIAADISPTTLNLFEMGRNSAHPATEVAIATALRWPADAFDRIRTGVDPADLPTIEPEEMVQVPAAQLQAVLEEIRALRRLVQDLGSPGESPS